VGKKNYFFYASRGLLPPLGT